MKFKTLGDQIIVFLNNIFCSGKVWLCELNSLKAKRGVTPKRGMKGVKFHTQGIEFHFPVVTFHTRRGIEFHSPVITFHTRMCLHMVKERASIRIHTSSGNSFRVCHQVRQGWSSCHRDVEFLVIQKGGVMNKLNSLGFYSSSFFPLFLAQMKTSSTAKKTHIGFIFFKGKFLYNFFFFKNKGCVVLWPYQFTLKSILRQKKNYRNSNIFPCKIIIFQKSSERNQNPSRYYYNFYDN